MKTLKNSLLIFIVFLFGVCCNDIPRIKKGVTFPDLISPIYYMDTFQIKSPRIAIVDTVPYIFSLEKLEQFENKEDFIGQKGVVRYLSSEMHSERYSGFLGIYDTSKASKSFSDLAYSSLFEFGFDMDELFLPDEDIKEIPVYKFAFKPETFIFTIISTKFNMDQYVLPAKGDCYFEPAVFSKDFILAISPVYSKRDLKKINKLYYQWFHGEDPDWTYYLPNWIYNLFL